VARKKSKSETPSTRAAVESNAAASERPVLLSLEGLHRKADELAAAQDWDALLALGSTLLSGVAEDSRPAAEVALLLMQVRARSRDWLGLPPGTTAEVKNELRELTRSLAERDERFHLRPEFAVFVDCLGYDFDDCYRGFKVLLRACAEHVNEKWVSRLRGCGLRLMDPYAYFDSVSEEQERQLEDLPDVDVALSGVLGRLENSEDTPADEKLLATVFRLELATRMADPWDYGQVAEAIRSLPTPSMAAVQARYTDRDANTTGHHLLPTAWAFLWELKHCSAEALPTLLQRYDGVELGNVLFEGLRDVARSVAGQQDCDTQLLQGVHQMMGALSDWTGWVGESITVSTTEGPMQVPFRYNSLEVPSATDALTNLLERAPATFPRLSELTVFVRVFGANESFGSLDDEQWTKRDDTGVDWLCGRSIPFQFAAAYALPNEGSRLLLFVNAVRRCAEQTLEPPTNYFSGDLTSENITLENVRSIQAELEELAEARAGMTERLVKMWRQEIGHVFSAISKFEGAPRKEALALAHAFAEDLLEARQAFRLGYLEQVEGDREQALRWYLVELAEAKDVSDALLNNMKLLWSGCDDHDVATALVAGLEEQVPHQPRAQVLATLIASAKARAATLERQAQYERTAVNRWPTLTAPARKLLGVLDNINRYNGFAELGEYAGMPVEWAERHYRKLVELGMVLETQTGYRINSHIKPLLDREGQHSVIGRIVRAHGTSAVKQVFNSQREYSIYQVMVQLCPNHLVFPNCALQSVMSFDRMKELVEDSDFGYYLRASVDLVVVSSTTFLPMLAIEVDSVWHDTDKQQERDDRKDRLFAVAGIPFMRLRPVGSPSEDVIRGQVAEHLDELVRSLRTDIPGYDQARKLLEDLSA
jgi:hypothetical protein